MEKVLAEQPRNGFLHRKLKASSESVADIPSERADPNTLMLITRDRANADAVDLRVIKGSTEEPGPGLIWIRLDHPLVAGESPSKFQQISTLCDLGAAVGWENSDDDQPFINSDVIRLLESWKVNGSYSTHLFTEF